MNLSQLPEIVKDREAWSAAAMELQRAGHDLVTEQQQPGDSGGLQNPACCGPWGLKEVDMTF